MRPSLPERSTGLLETLTWAPWAFSPSLGHSPRGARSQEIHMGEERETLSEEETDWGAGYILEAEGLALGPGEEGDS